MSSKTNNAGRMTSISKKINASFVGKLMLNTVKLDLLIFIVVLFLGGYFAERYTTGEFKINRERRLEDNQEGGIDYIIIDKKSGEEFCVNFTDREQFVFNGFFAVLILLQAVSVIRYACTNQNDINRKLKPLYDLAKKTEEISDLAYDEQYFKSLEDAISNVNADMPDAHISTQNKELKGIEIALNNLLDRMRESYRQQTRFVSDASHELRTPIAVIRGYADMLDRWGKEDESILLESIEAIKNESANMQKLVEQLLFLARGDSGRNNLKIERINLAVLLREVYEESKMIDEKHYFDFQAEDAIMKGDVAMVKQSARIFVDNATKYTTPGDTISIRTGKNENGVYFQIQDNGIGMKESDVVHVFERFYRSDEARNRKSGGTGLGLSIAKWIVDRHGGRINVLSRPEIGTRITVYFEEDKSFDHVEKV